MRIRRGVPCVTLLAVAGLALLMAIPLGGGTSSVPLAPAPARGLGSGAGIATPSPIASLPPASPSIAGSGAATPAGGARPLFSGHSDAPSATPTELSPAAAKPYGYDWSSAYVGYGPPWPPADKMLGEGAGLVTDNALDEFVWFGGLTSTGLSNATVTYEYYYYDNYTENGSSTNSSIWPSSRANVSFGAYQAGGEALLFGGITNLRTQATTNDSWFYNFANDTWINITNANAPPPRESAAFAVDQQDGIALMFGGIAPSYSAHGVTGAVIWQDTWEFKFSSRTWKEVPTVISPGDRFGSSMVWDPKLDEFLLVGGCSFSCTMDVWAFSVANGTWQQLSQTGTVPPARAGAAFDWDPGAGQAVLYGGYSLDPNGGYLIYDDSYVLKPSGQWISETVQAPGPAPIYQAGPVYGANTVWANFPGCNAMWISGGDPTLQGPPEFVYVIQPTNDTPNWQCWSFLSEPQGPPGPPPPCSQQGSLVVTVEDNRTQAPIPNALVEISGECLPATESTGSTGVATFTVNVPDNISINVSAINYHGHQEWFNFTYTNTSANTSREQVRYVEIRLDAYPGLSVQVLAETGGPLLIPVENAQILIDYFAVIAVTGPTGWGNVTALPEFDQYVNVSVVANDYSNSSKTVFLPYTGVINVTLVVKRAGWLTVHVVRNDTGAPIEGANGEVTRTDPGLPYPFAFTTPNSTGTFVVRLPLGNYTVTATAPGYLPNRTGGHVYMNWVANSSVTVRLTPDYGTNESVRLLDAVTGKPIPGGLVTFGGDPPIVTSSSGWANGTDLGPPGKMLVVGRADGYLPNSTTIVLGFDTKLPAVTLHLTPVCSGNCAGSNGGLGGAGSPFFPTGGSSLALLLSAPAVLAIAGALYAVALSANRARRSSATRRPLGLPGAES